MRNEPKEQKKASMYLTKILPLLTELIKLLRAFLTILNLYNLML